MFRGIFILQGSLSIIKEDKNTKYLFSWPSLQQSMKNDLDWLWTECVSPKFICWSSHSQCDGIWRQGSWEVIRFRQGSEVRSSWWDLQSPLIRRDQRACFLCLSSLWGHSKKVGVCKLGRRPSTETKSTSTLGLGLPNFQMVRSNCWFLSQPMYGIFLQQPEQTKIPRVC